jgi:hypothetical protein
LTDIEVGVAAGLTALQILARDVTLADVVNSATETTVFSGTVPGGTLGTDGFVELLAQGELLCTASTIVLTVRVKYGGVTFVSGAINMNANASLFALWIHAYLSASGSSTAERGSGEIVVGAAARWLIHRRSRHCSTTPVAGRGTMRWRSILQLRNRSSSRSPGPARP